MSEPRTGMFKLSEKSLSLKTQLDIKEAAHTAAAREITAYCDRKTNNWTNNPINTRENNWLRDPVYIRLNDTFQRTLSEFNRAMAAFHSTDEMREIIKKYNLMK
jgi:hypothetical protein